MTNTDPYVVRPVVDNSCGTEYLFLRVDFVQRLAGHLLGVILLTYFVGSGYADDSPALQRAMRRRADLLRHGSDRAIGDSIRPSRQRAKDASPAENRAAREELNRQWWLYRSEFFRSQLGPSSLDRFAAGGPYTSYRWLSPYAAGTSFGSLGYGSPGYGSPRYGRRPSGGRSYSSGAGFYQPPIIPLGGRGLYPGRLTPPGR